MSSNPSEQQTRIAFIREVFDEIEELNSCMEAVAALMIPNGYIDQQERDKVSVLMNRLNRWQDQLLAQLKQDVFCEINYNLDKVSEISKAATKQGS